MTNKFHTDMILRPYQELAIQELREGIRQHPGQPGLLVAPTGSGKSQIFGWMAHSAVSKGKRVGAAVNRRILVNDLCKRVHGLGLDHGVIMGSEPRRAWAKVHIASLDTLWRRELPKWDICYIDEAHFSLAPKYSAVIRKLVEQGTVVIGMTATPIAGNQGLGSIYKWMVRCPDTPELIDSGYLVKPRVFAPSAPDLKKVKTTAGEFNQKQLAQVCDQTKLTGDILQHWIKNGRGKPTIAFGVDINHCKHMAEMFAAAGVRTMAVDHTYRGDFDLVWRKLQNYEMEVVFNVGIAGYGWDAPKVEVMIEARPTQSLGLWLQHCGRVLRTAQGKPWAIILDHAGNSLRHGLPDEPRDWQLDGPAVVVKDDKKPPAVATCKHAYRWPDGRHEPPRIINGVQLPCYATFRAGPELCPYCQLPLRKNVRKVEVEAGELQEITKAPESPEVKSRNERIMRSVYDALKKKQEEKGWKPKYASVVFKQKYGVWPPRQWQ